MDIPRCLCARDAEGKLHRSLDCPYHGFNGGDPKVRYELGVNDRRFLKSLRIKAEDDRDKDIEETRQADEDRFKP